ncbi:MAG: hypothetical protein ACPGLV_04900 [Bacteroidia bacterium]
MKNIIISVLALFAILFLSSCGESSIENAVNKDIEYTLQEQALETDKHEYCDSLHVVLRKSEKGSDTWKSTFKLIKDSCEKPLKPSPCDSLKRVLKSQEKGSNEYMATLKLIKLKCSKNKEIKTPCDSLKLKLSQLEKGSDAYNRVLKIIKQKCGDYSNNKLNCDEIKEKLKTLDKQSDEYKKLFGVYYAHCIKDKDQKNWRVYRKEDGKSQQPKNGDRKGDFKIEKD